MLVMQIMKHSPEACPMGVKKNAESLKKMMARMESLTAKNKMKVVGIWVDPPGHAFYAIYDTPSMDNLMGFMMEPELMATMTFQTIETKPLFTGKEALGLLE